MIVVTRKENGYTSEGHAEYNEGNDIVCSAVSALTQTALRGLLDRQRVNFNMKEGYLDVTVEKTDFYANEIIRIMFLGIKDLETQYPDNIKVEYNYE